MQKYHYTCGIMLSCLPHAIILMINSKMYVYVYVFTVNVYRPGGTYRRVAPVLRRDIVHTLLDKLGHCCGEFISSIVKIQATRAWRDMKITKAPFI